MRGALGDQSQTPNNFRESIAENFRVRYTPLFQLLGLNSDESQALLDLMVAEAATGKNAKIGQREGEFITQIEIAGPTQDELPRVALLIGSTVDRAEAAQRRAEAVAPIEAEISKLLGPDKYALYETYRQAEPIARSIDTFSNHLKYSGQANPLTESQAAQMLAIMLAEPAPAPDQIRLKAEIPDSLVKAGPSFLDPAQQAMLEQQQLYQRQVAAAAAEAIEAKRRENATGGGN
jgi:hypothetical protein